MSSSRIAVYLAIGVGLGLAVGYIFMGERRGIACHPGGGRGTLLPHAALAAARSRRPLAIAA